MAAVVLTKDNFEQEVLKSDKPVLVDFWAPWCGPCKMVGPIIEEIANEVTDKVIGKVNVDEQGDLAAEYGIMSIPTLALFIDGKIAKQAVGAKDKAGILALLS